VDLMNNKYVHRIFSLSTKNKVHHSIMINSFTASTAVQLLRNNLKKLFISQMLKMVKER